MEVRIGERTSLKLIDPIQVKPCDGCRACCTVLGVHELGKVNYEPCQHECDKGCAIYEERPTSCRAFYCGWAQGCIPGRPDFRPDRLGVIFDYSLTSECWLAWEVFPGAAQSKKAQKAIRRLGWPVTVVDEAWGRASKYEDVPPEWHEAGAVRGEEIGERLKELMGKGFQ